ncbi:MAG TPA: LLM class flavin-dependent oxidoreductase [Tepidisphaeraceae bacterium]|jgi:alkanesulfonate monooxygenase|nr:LLM class flavin-dependent oxidoreductase [Tepidisphaeraceae bacterium]
MTSRLANDPHPVEIYSTCPTPAGKSPEEYLENVAAVSRWSEEAGCRGILVYTDNSMPDPWLVSQIIIQSTKRLCPLVAVQPVYMHPFAVAKMLGSLAHVYGRRVCLNMVAGGFANDLAALCDTTPHDRRYDRMVEYTTIIQRLLRGPEPVTYQGEFYKVVDLKMTPALPSTLFPGIFVSGSSPAGLAAARRLGATAVKYPKPAGEEIGDWPDDRADSGIRIGLIVRETEAEAWDVAHARFPADRKGQLTHQLAMKTSDSAWHRQLSTLAGEPSAGEASPYWLVPFQTYKTFCPYLVGSFETVAGELARYIAAGYRKYILDIPPEREELSYIGAAFELALLRINA